MDKRIKILFVHHAAGWGGAPISMIKLINHLDKNKYSPEVLLLKNSIVAQKLSENNIPYKIADSVFYKRYYKFFTHIDVSYFKWYKLFRLVKLFMWLLSRYHYAHKELSKHHFDIVHLNSSALTDWLAPAHKKAKVVIHIREPFRKGKYDILHHFFRKQMQLYADKIVAISKDNAARVDLPEKTNIIYNFSEIPQKTTDTTSYRSKKVLYLGGSENIKGFFTMVEALDFLDNDVKVLFGGYYSTKLLTGIKAEKKIKDFLGFERKKRNAIRTIKTHPNAIYVGVIDQVSPYYEKTCCLVSPFAKSHFARPVIEAYLHKKPAIGTNIKGMSEIIIHKKTGLLVQNENAQELAQAINKLAAQPDLAQEYGCNAYTMAQERYSTKNTQLFENLYHTLIYDN